MYNYQYFKGKNEKDNKYLKRLILQLTIVFALMLFLIILKYVSFSSTLNVSLKFKDMFYKDYSQTVTASTIKLFPNIMDIFKKNKEGEELINILPVNGSITSGFGKRTSPITGKEEEHSGVDIDAEVGTEVKCVMDGRVKQVEQNETAGLMVLIDHGSGYETLYAHLSEIKVEVGDNVKEGQVIALSGNTGQSTGPHLHYELRLDGTAIDPISITASN